MRAGLSENKEQKIEEEPKVNTKKQEIIKEGNTDSAPPIQERDSKKLYNSIYRINVESKEGNIMGTGFFIRLNLKHEMKLFLVTCYHIIQKQYADEKITITLYYGEFNKEKCYKIKLDENERYIKCFSRSDITLIEIIDKDDISKDNKDNYLLPDLNYKNGLDFYKNNFVYLAGYPKIGLNKIERSISSGQIINIIDEAEFEHSIYTGPGNSGSPICFSASNNLFVVGTQLK